MKKFNNLYKEHQERSNQLFEEKVLNDFNSVYSGLLEKYNIFSFDKLNEKMKTVFLNELHSFWVDVEGITEKGKKFLQNKSMSLTEYATPLQKTNYLRKKMVPIISETVRQTGLKWKLYDVINEVYKETGASQLNEVLTSESLVGIIKESLTSSLSQFLKEINYELKESGKTEEVKKKNKPINEEVKQRLVNPNQRAAVDLVNKCAKENGLKVKGFKVANGIVEVRMGNRLGNFLASITSSGNIETFGFGKSNYAPDEFEDYITQICNDIVGNASKSI